MKTKQEIVKQYVASLKEDRELDYIFPLLLERMGFRVLSTPKQSKGQSQYGRDVIAVKREKGINTLFLFELKGFRAKDINDKSLNETDGLIESMRASKNTLYRDASIPDLDTYARKYVFVHNGYVEANSVATLDGFVSTEFPEKNFERWGLDKLTELFSKYLFEETILTDSESYRLFKKVLVLLDSEGNDYSDIVSLVERQIELVDSHKNLSKKTELFNKRLCDELAVETGIQLPETLEEFQETFSKTYDSIQYRTDKAGFFYLRILAHIYYQTDFFPDFLGKKFCRAIHLC